MKSVLRSIKPYWFYLICEGKKTIEVGKDCPKATDWNRTVELYCSKDIKSFNRIPKEYQEKYRKYLGRVGAKFICDEVHKYEPQVILCAYYEVNGAAVKENLRYNSGTCLSYEDMVNYSNGKTLYGWHISNLVVYDKPKELREFFTPIGKRPSYMIERPPQSWCYIEEQCDNN